MGRVVSEVAGSEAVGRVEVGYLCGLFMVVISVTEKTYITKLLHDTASEKCCANFW